MVTKLNKTVYKKLSLLHCIVCFLNKLGIILLLKTVDSLMGIWNCGIIHKLMNDGAGTEDREYQEYQDCLNLYLGG